jgi:hypothetical protein
MFSNIKAYLFGLLAALLSLAIIYFSNFGHSGNITSDIIQAHHKYITASTHEEQTKIIDSIRNEAASVKRDPDYVSRDPVLLKWCDSIIEH